MKVEIDDDLIDIIMLEYMWDHHDLYHEFAKDLSEDPAIRLYIDMAVERIVREWLGFARLNMMCGSRRHPELEAILEQGEAIYKARSEEIAKKNSWFRGPAKKNDKDSKTEETQE